jgi:hypothetical protein
MKLTIRTLLRVFLVIVPAVISLPAIVSAQQFSMQPPVVRNTVPPPIGRSMAYVDAGVKWRNIEKIRFERNDHAVAGRGLTGRVLNQATIDFTEQLFTPVVEYGQQYGNFFGLLLGLSGFGLSEKDTAVTAGEMSSGDTFTETLFQRFDVTTIEFKAAGRSWFPVFEAGSVGVAFGGLFAVSPYEIETRSIAIADGRNIVQLPQGTVIQNVDNKVKDTHLNLGMCASADLEAGTDRYFLKGTMEFDWYFIKLHHRGVVDAYYNPSGLAFSLVGGLRF